MTRHPYDGEPYYCTLCGLGYHEYLACEESVCKLEPKQNAETRRFGNPSFAKTYDRAFGSIKAREAKRSRYDGKPYYCITCGFPFFSIHADCGTENIRCKLESKEEAIARKERWEKCVSE